MHPEVAKVSFCQITESGSVPIWDSMAQTHSCSLLVFTPSLTCALYRQTRTLQAFEAPTRAVDWGVQGQVSYAASSGLLQVFRQSFDHQLQAAVTWLSVFVFRPTTAQCHTVYGYGDGTRRLGAKLLGPPTATRLSCDLFLCSWPSTTDSTAGVAQRELAS